MPFSDEIVMAYVDGELGDATRAAIEVAMTTDADLAQRVARHRELRKRVQGAFDPVLAEPVPERLLAAAKGMAANVHDGNIVARSSAFRHDAGPGHNGARLRPVWSLVF